MPDIDFSQLDLFYGEPPEPKPAPLPHGKSCYCGACRRQFRINHRAETLARVDALAQSSSAVLPEAPATQPAHLCQHLGGVRPQTGGWSMEHNGEWAGAWVHADTTCRKPAFEYWLKCIGPCGYEIELRTVNNATDGHFDGMHENRTCPECAGRLEPK